MKRFVFCVLFVLFSSSVFADRFPAYSNLSPAMRQCISKKAGRDVLAKLERGLDPGDSSGAVKADKFYAHCLLKLKEKLPEEVGFYAGPYFDAMSQIDEKVRMGRAIERVREAGVDKLALFARSRKKLGQNERAVLRLAVDNNDLILLGAPKYFRHKKDISDSYSSAMLKGIEKHGYKFVGEILYTHGDKKSGASYASGERYTDPSLPGTDRFLSRLVEKNIPLMTHFEVYAPDRDFHRFHDLYERWPDQIFIIPHMAFGSPQQVDEFLSRHDNVYMTMSKKAVKMDNFRDSDKLAMTGSAMLVGLSLKPEWSEILIKHQDRILAATDAHMKKLWSEYPTHVFLSRVVLGQLPKEVAQKIAYKNAERVYGVKIQ